MFLNMIPAAHQAAERRVRAAAAEAAVRAIEAADSTPASTPADTEFFIEAARRIVTRYRQRIDRYTPAAKASDSGDRADVIERQLSLLGLRAERTEVLRAGRAHDIEEVTQSKLVREIDLQEARYSA